MFGTQQYQFHQQCQQQQRNPGWNSHENGSSRGCSISGGGGTFSEHMDCTPLRSAGYRSNYSANTSCCNRQDFNDVFNPYRTPVQSFPVCRPHNNDGVWNNVESSELACSSMLIGNVSALPQPVPEYTSCVGSWYQTPSTGVPTNADNEENCPSWLDYDYALPTTFEQHPNAVSAPVDAATYLGRSGSSFLSPPGTHLRSQRALNYSCYFAATSTPSQPNFTASPTLSTSGCCPDTDGVHRSMEVPVGSDAYGVPRHSRTRRHTKRRPYSRAAISKLSAWFETNRHHPYATRLTTEQLAVSTNLTYNQVRKWLANTRAANKVKDNAD